MSDMKDKVKRGIDKAADKTKAAADTAFDKTKSAAEKVIDKSKDATRSAGNAVTKAGEKLKDAGKK